MFLKSVSLLIVTLIVDGLGQFVLPVARVKVLTPKGFEVSVPHQDGMVLFAFHGKINDRLNEHEAGTFSQDILKPENERWVFRDTNTELKPGDILYYWYYIQTEEGGQRLGYESKLLTFNVTGNVIKNRKNPPRHKWKPLSLTLYILQLDYVTLPDTPATTSSTTAPTTIPTTTIETDQEKATTVPSVSSIQTVPNCGSCYGAGLTDSQCCNTCDEVKEAYKIQKWSLPDLNNIEQCREDSEGSVETGEQLVESKTEVNTEKITSTLPNVDEDIQDVIIGPVKIPEEEQKIKPTNLLIDRPYVQLAQSLDADCPASPTTVSGNLKPQRICSQQLIFSDEFDKFDLQKWQHENTLAGGGNWEFQWYTNNRSNSFVRDGTLHIRPTLVADEYGENFLYSGTLDLNGGAPADICTNAAFYGCIRSGSAFNILNPVKSARIRTVDSFNFKYGRVEIRAKTPTGDWLWPAIWLLPRYNAYGGWPASGEIDILESRGNKKLIHNGKDIGANLVTSTLHFGPNYAYNRYTYAQYEKKSDPANTFYDSFHNYTMIWTPGSITFYYDDDKVGEVRPSAGGFWELGHLNNSGVHNPWENSTPMAPFDQEFYLIINLAVGGVNGYFPDDAVGTNEKPWKNNSPKAATDFWNRRDLWLPSWYLNVTGDTDASFQIDYVRIYAL